MSPPTLYSLFYSFLNKVIKYLHLHVYIQSPHHLWCMLNYYNIKFISVMVHSGTAAIKSGIND